MATIQSLPHWDMSVIYPGLESPEFAQSFEHIVQKIADLVKLFDAHQIMKRSDLIIDENLVQTFETIVEHYNEVLESITTLSVYIDCFINTNLHSEAFWHSSLDVIRRDVALFKDLTMRGI